MKLKPTPNSQSSRYSQNRKQRKANPLQKLCFLHHAEPPPPHSLIAGAERRKKTKFALKTPLQTDSKQNEERNPALRKKLLTPHLCFLHAEPPPPPHKSPSRTISKKIEFSPSTLGCAVLCLPKPPPHHTPEFTATEFAGAVRGAWKQTGAAVSHDPKAGALEKIVKASQLEIIELQHSVGELRYQTRRNHGSRGGNLTQLGKVGARLVVRKMANKRLARTKIMLPSLLSLLINQ